MLEHVETMTNILYHGVVEIICSVRIKMKKSDSPQRYLIN